MKIEFDNGKLYVGSVYHSFYETTDGKGIPAGMHRVHVDYSHVHRRNQPFIDGIGWIGTTKDCAVILGRVMGYNSMIPDQFAVDRLVLRIEDAEESGESVLAGVSDG